MNGQLSAEIDRNFFAFQIVNDAYLKEHNGSFAVIHDQKVMSVHEKLSDAIKQAHSDYPDGIFSIQEVTDKPMDLGFFSHAWPLR